MLSKEESYQKIEPRKTQDDRSIGEGRAAEVGVRPTNVALKDYCVSWADEILPIASEAHERLQFIDMHEIFDQGHPVMAGVAREKNIPGRPPYADWSAKIVRDEMHKAGWRLADLLTQAVGQSTSLHLKYKSRSP